MNRDDFDAPLHRLSRKGRDTVGGGSSCGESNHTKRIRICSYNLERLSSDASRRSEQNDPADVRGLGRVFGLHALNLVLPGPVPPERTRPMLCA